MDSPEEYPWTTRAAAATSIGEGCFCGGGEERCWPQSEPGVQRGYTAVGAPEENGCKTDTTTRARSAKEDCACGTVGGYCWFHCEPGVQQEGTTMESPEEYAFRSTSCMEPSSLQERCEYGDVGGRRWSHSESGVRPRGTPTRRASLDRESFSPRAPLPLSRSEATASVGADAGWGEPEIEHRELPSAGIERRRRRHRRYARHWRTGAGAQSTTVTGEGHQSDVCFAPTAEGGHLMECRLQGPLSGPQCFQQPPYTAQGELHQGAGGQAYRGRVSFQLDLAACGRGGPLSAPQVAHTSPFIAEGEEFEHLAVARSSAYRGRASFQLDQAARGRGGREARDGSASQCRTAGECASCPVDANVETTATGSAAEQVPKEWGRGPREKGPWARESSWEGSEKGPWARESSWEGSEKGPCPERKLREEERLQGLSEDDLELRLLVQKLRLACSIRDVAALRCERFTRMLEASLHGSNA